MPIAASKKPGYLLEFIWPLPDWEQEQMALRVFQEKHKDKIDDPESASRWLREVEGELRLQIEELFDATRKYQRFFGSTNPKSIEKFQEVEAWIFSDDDREHMSFVNVCATFNFEPSYIRRLLKLSVEQKKRGTFKGLKQPRVFTVRVSPGRISSRQA